MLCFTLGSRTFSKKHQILSRLSSPSSSRLKTKHKILWHNTFITQVFPSWKQYTVDLISFIFLCFPPNFSPLDISHNQQTLLSLDINCSCQSTLEESPLSSIYFLTLFYSVKSLQISNILIWYFTSITHYQQTLLSLDINCSCQSTLERRALSSIYFLTLF
jgi:hypothetical protein